MTEIVTTIGHSTKTACCIKCNWFEGPKAVAGTGMVLPRLGKITCPVCGADTVEKAGKYKVRTTLTLWGLCRDNEFIDFIREE